MNAVENSRRRRPLAVYANRWCLWTLVLCALSCGKTLHAQMKPAAAEYQLYSLQNKSASDVEKILRELLADADPPPHIVADPRENQILVRGSEETHRLVRELIDSVDGPQTAPQTPSNPVARLYFCPEANRNAIAEKLRWLFGQKDGARVTVVEDTKQLLVLARPDVHERISRQLQLWNVERRKTGEGMSPASANVPSAQVEKTQIQSIDLRFIRVAQVDSTLHSLLGNRMQPAGSGATDLRIVNSDDRQLQLSLNQTTNTITLAGDSLLMSQMARLIRLLDTPPNQPDRTVRIVPLRRADPVKIKQAVEAYRSEPLQNARPQHPLAPTTPRGEENPSREVTNPLREGQSFLDSRHTSAIQQAAFQEAGPATGGSGAQQPPAALSGSQERTDVGTRELGSEVQIETLPDLDAIILFGRDTDVDELARIIEEIERLSLETQPEIEILYLKHVRGESLVRIVQEIHQQYVGGRQGRVSVLPLMKPNALLLIGWGEAVQAIKDLVKKLDQPVSPNTQFQVFRLQHAPAITVQATVQQFFAGRTGLGPDVQATADSRTNSLVVEAAPSDMAEVKLLVEQLDRPDSQAVNRVQVFTLKNTLAANLASTLQSAIQVAAGNVAGRKSSVLEFLTIDAGKQRLLRSGLLNDVRITPDTRANTLVVSAPAESMELVAALIQHLDEASIATAQIKVFRVQNGDATALVRMLQTLMPSQAGATNVPQLPTAEGETSLVPVRFAVDIRTNSIIATGSAGDLEIIEALLLRLDEKDSLVHQKAVYRLRNAPAADVARAVSDFLRSQRQVEQAAPGAVSPYLQIEREVVVVPEPVSNSLILSATPRYFEEIMRLIEDLDAQPPQVMIQVLIAEVSLGDLDEVGVELGIQDSVLFDRSIIEKVLTVNETNTSPNGVQTTNERILSQTGSPGFDFINQPLGNNLQSDATAFAGQAISNFAMGRANSELQFGGLVLSASNESVNVLIRALQDRRRLEVLSRPQVMTLDNQPAFIQVGQRVPRIVGSQVNNVGQVNNIELENVGLILGVTPRISPEGMVVLEVDAEKSDLGPEAEGIPISISPTGNVIRSPRTDIQTAQTTISAADGQTVVLGGLITKRTSEITRRVPYLGEIPVLGQLFRYDSLVAERSELLIILTPHIIRSPEDVDRMKHIEGARMHWVAADVHELHGESAFCTPGACPICDGQIPVVYPDFDPLGTLPELQEPASDETGPSSIDTPTTPDSDSTGNRIPSGPNDDVSQERFPVNTPLTVPQTSQRSPRSADILATGHETQSHDPSLISAERRIAAVGTSSAQSRIPRRLPANSQDARPIESYQSSQQPVFTGNWESVPEDSQTESRFAHGGGGWSQPPSTWEEATSSPETSARSR